MSTKNFISITGQKLKSARIYQKIIKLIHNENGLVFPYILSIMLLASSYLIVLTEKERFHLEQIQLLEEQQIIQNLIQISIHDFNHLKDELPISTDEQTTSFNYETGNTTIKYQLISDNLLKLQVLVYTENNQTDPFIHSKIFYV